jgi:hypothetical protein
MEFQALERGQFSHKPLYPSRHNGITTGVHISPFADLIAAASSVDQKDWEFLHLSVRFCLISDPVYDTPPYPTTIDVSRQFGRFFRYRGRVDESSRYGGTG